MLSLNFLGKLGKFIYEWKKNDGTCLEILDLKVYMGAMEPKRVLYMIIIVIEKKTPWQHWSSDVDLQLNYTYYE